MICDLGFTVSANKEDFDTLGEMLIFAMKADLDPPKTWGEEENTIVARASLITAILRQAKEVGELEELRERMPKQVYTEGLSLVKQAVPLLVSTIRSNCPEYMTFAEVDGEYKFVPNRDSIASAKEFGVIHGTEDKAPSVYEKDGVTIYLNKNGEIEWMV